MIVLHPDQYEAYRLYWLSEVLARLWVLLGKKLGEEP